MDDLLPMGDGDLAPFTPASPTLPSVQGVDAWITPSPDFNSGVTLYQGQSAPQLFGLPVPGAGPEHTGAVQQVLTEITTLFQSDMRQLGFPQTHINAAVNWFKEAAVNPPTYSATHSYSLKGFKIPESDKVLVNDFLAEMESFSADERFCMTALWWINQLSQRLNSQPAHQPAQTRSIDDLSDKEFAQLEHKYHDDAQKAEAVLRREWSWSYEQNIAIAQRFFSNLPERERTHIANDVINGVSALNSPDVVMFLYQQAIGVTSQLSGGNLAKRIQEIEHIMKTDRKAYNSNEELQAELRHLYAMRG